MIRNDKSMLKNNQTMLLLFSHSNRARQCNMHDCGLWSEPTVFIFFYFCMKSGRSAINDFGKSNFEQCTMRASVRAFFVSVHFAHRCVPECLFGTCYYDEWPNVLPSCTTLISYHLRTLARKTARTHIHIYAMQNSRARTHTQTHARERIVWLGMFRNILINLSQCSLVFCSARIVLWLSVNMHVHTNTNVRTHIRAYMHEHIVYIHASTTLTCRTWRH